VAIALADHRSDTAPVMLLSSAFLDTRAPSLRYAGAMTEFCREARDQEYPCMRILCRNRR
jgi:hypothetical protein